jgi:hypothetical protein
MNLKCSNCNQENYNVFKSLCNHYMCIECFLNGYKYKNTKCVVCSKLLLPVIVKKRDSCNTLIHYDNMTWFDEETRQLSSSNI